MVSTHRFPYPSNPSVEAVVVAYPHVDKWYTEYHKHVIDEDGSHRIPSGLHSDRDKEFLIQCRETVIDRLAQQGISVEC